MFIYYWNWFALRRHGGKQWQIYCINIVELRVKKIFIFYGRCLRYGYLFDIEMRVDEYLLLAIFKQTKNIGNIHIAFHSFV